jgi:hypothetical protein
MRATVQTTSDLILILSHDERMPNTALQAIVNSHYQENTMNKDQAKGRIEEVKGKVKEVAGKAPCNSRECVHDTVWRKYGGAFRQSVSSHL